MPVRRSSPRDRTQHLRLSPKANSEHRRRIPRLPHHQPRPDSRAFLVRSHLRNHGLSRRHLLPPQALQGVGDRCSVPTLRTASRLALSASRDRRTVAAGGAARGVGRGGIARQDRSSDRVERGKSPSTLKVLSSRIVAIPTSPGTPTPTNAWGPFHHKEDCTGPHPSAAIASAADRGTTYPPLESREPTESPRCWVRVSPPLARDPAMLQQPTRRT